MIVSLTPPLPSCKPLHSSTPCRLAFILLVDSADCKPQCFYGSHAYVVKLNFLGTEKKLKSHEIAFVFLGQTKPVIKLLLSVVRS